MADLDGRVWSKPLPICPLLAAGVVILGLRLTIPRLSPVPIGGAPDADFSQATPVEQPLAGWACSGTTSPSCP